MGWPRARFWPRRRPAAETILPTVRRRAPEVPTGRLKVKGSVYALGWFRPSPRLWPIPLLVPVPLACLVTVFLKSWLAASSYTPPSFLGGRLCCGLVGPVRIGVTICCAQLVCLVAPTR
jgi:uncharacterized RDD family membrane protein YckC